MIKLRTNLGRAKLKGPANEYQAAPAYESNDLRSINRDTGPSNPYRPTAPLPQPGNGLRNPVSPPPRATRQPGSNYRSGQAPTMTSQIRQAQPVYGEGFTRTAGAAMSSAADRGIVTPSVLLKNARESAARARLELGPGVTQTQGNTPGNQALRTLAGDPSAVSKQSLQKQNQPGSESDQRDLWRQGERDVANQPPPDPDAEIYSHGHPIWIQNRVQEYIDNNIISGLHGSHNTPSGYARALGVTEEELLYLLERGYEFQWKDDPSPFSGEEWMARTSNTGWEDWHDDGGRRNLGADNIILEARQRARSGEPLFGPPEQEDPARSALEEYLESIGARQPPAFPEEELQKLQAETRRLSAQQQAASMQALLESNARGRGAVGSGVAAASAAQRALATEEGRQIAAQNLEAQIQNYQQQIAHYASQIDGIRRFYSHELSEVERAAMVEAEKTLSEHQALLARSLAAAQSDFARIMTIIGGTVQGLGGIAQGVGSFF